MQSQRINHRPSGIAESQQLCHFVIGLAGGVISRAPDVFVCPAVLAFFRQKQMRVPAGNHQRQQRKINLEISFLLFFQQHRVDVPFKMVHGDQRLFQRKRQRLGITDARPAKLQPAPALA